MAHHDKTPTDGLDLVPQALSPASTGTSNTEDAPQQSSDGVDQPKHKLVTFAHNDPGNPKNWSKGFKWYCTMVVAATCFVVALNSSVITADIAGVEEEFGVSEEVALVSISLFVVGFGVGPMVFAPLSEIYGRRII
jgi:hypothetical protein